jgi:preprotein translocase subunit YajC
LNNLGLLVIYVVAFIAIFYFLAIRPQQRQRRAHDALVAAAKKGDRIVTAGGIFGTIKRVEDSSVLLEVAKGVEIRIARKAIAEVISDDQAKPAGIPAPKNDKAAKAEAEAELEAAPEEVEDDASADLETPAEDDEPPAK